MTGSDASNRQSSAASEADAPAMSTALSWALAVVVLAVILGLGSLFPPDAWYLTIRKPTWQPPGWVFAPVWITLYLLLVAGLALLLQAPRSAERSEALAWYSVHLVLNVSWSPLFFGAHSPGLAFVNICIQWLVLAMSIQAGFRVRTWAGWLQLPTMAWVSFALVLNGVIVALNF